MSSMLPSATEDCNGCGCRFRVDLNKLSFTVSCVCGTQEMMNTSLANDEFGRPLTMEQLTALRELFDAAKLNDVQALRLIVHNFPRGPFLPCDVNPCLIRGGFTAQHEYVLHVAAGYGRQEVIDPLHGTVLRVLGSLKLRGRQQKCS